MNLLALQSSVAATLSLSIAAAVRHQHSTPSLSQQYSIDVAVAYMRPSITLRAATGRIVGNAPRYAYLVGYFRMEHPTIKQRLEFNAIVAKPTIEFGDDVASASGKANFDYVHISDTALPPWWPSIDNWSASPSSLLVANRAGFVPSVARKLGRYRFVGSRPSSIHR